MKSIITIEDQDYIDKNMSILIPMVDAGIIKNDYQLKAVIEEIKRQELEWQH